MLNSALILLLSLNAVLSRNVTEKEWKEYKIKFGKTYTAAEEQIRKQIYSANVNEIDKHNEMHAQGKFTYTKGINQFTDMTQKEFKELYLTNQKKHPEIVERNDVTPSIKPFDEEINWVKKGAVTPVKDQGKCIAHYAFSVVASLESANFIKHGELISLSEQQIVDCDPLNCGCFGGDTDLTFEYMTLIGGGLEAEKTYPYVAKQGKCRFQAGSIKVKLDSYNLTVNDEEILYKLLKQQPIAVDVDAENWWTYKGGIFQGTGSIITHSLLLVGLGNENNTPYWLLKNSWGTSWGEKGYIRLLRDQATSCIGAYSYFVKIV